MVSGAPTPADRGVQDPVGAHRDSHRGAGGDGSAVGSTSAHAVGLRGLRAAGRQLGSLTLFGLVPALLAVIALVEMHRAGNEWGFDFRGTIWEPAGDVLDGVSPYPPPTLEAMLTRNPSLYPPLGFLLATPLGALPLEAARPLWSALLFVGVLAALRLVGVTDWRCHSLALTSPPVLHGVYFGNLTLLLLVPVALAWRWRDQSRGGGALGVGVAAKLFLWPLGGWLVLTKRGRVLAISALTVALLVLVPWGVIGFRGLRDYPALLGVADDVFAAGSYSIPTAVAQWATSDLRRAAACLLSATALFGVAALLARRDDGDRRSFSVMVTACIFASPIVWPNYFALMLVPLAIARPRVGALWFAPLLLWAPLASDDSAVRAAGCLAWAIGLLILVVSREERRPIGQRTRRAVA